MASDTDRYLRRLEELNLTPEQAKQLLELLRGFAEGILNVEFDGQGRKTYH